jgi:hypothetical protein
VTLIISKPRVAKATQKILVLLGFSFKIKYAKQIIIAGIALVIIPAMLGFVYRIPNRRKILKIIPAHNDWKISITHCFLVIHFRLINCCLKFFPNNNRTNKIMEAKRNLNDKINGIDTKEIKYLELVILIAAIN